ncbi:MAG: DNRLRE domain-containing protein [Gammaproteobacteria bacterium]
MRAAYSCGLALAALWAGGAAPVAAVEVVTLTANRDNTLYETDPDQGGQVFERSNGQGIYLFVGRTGSDGGNRLRRALIAFDVAGQVPAGASVRYVKLTLSLSQASPGSPPLAIELHRATADWGEGASNALASEGQGAAPAPGDATWFQTFYGMNPAKLWTKPGGDYAAQSSSNATATTVTGLIAWLCTAALVADVQAWLNNPASNQGWVVLGDGGPFSAHRFISRNSARIDERPQLMVAYQPPGEILADGFEDGLPCN